MKKYAILSFYILAFLPTGALSQDWITGKVAVDWQSGFLCAPKGKCFEIQQTGMGQIGPVVGTKNCWRKQIWITEIRGIPADIQKHEVLSASGYWQYGVEGVEFAKTSATIRTYVIQDHGGPDNRCLAPGAGRFVISLRLAQ